MSTCTECNPCNSQEDWELIRATVIPSDECVTDCCSPCWWTSWGATWWLNIQWEWCVTIDTSECWVVKVKVPCPEPTQVVAWKNVTVNWPTEWDEWYDIKWKVNADNNKVSVCWSDKEWYLDDKIVAGNWIDIDTDCSSWKMKISIDENILPKCPDIPSVVVDDSQCSLVKASYSWHHITLRDNNTSNSAFCKLRLENTASFSLPNNNTDKWQVVNWQWDDYKCKWAVIKSKNKNMQHNVDVTDWWVMKIVQKWLYHISFSGSVEINSWVHAFRAQLYSSTESSSEVKTILESRYSWPVWRAPTYYSWYPLRVDQTPEWVTWAHFDSDDEFVKNTSWEKWKVTWKALALSTPLRASKLDIDVKPWDWHSSSLGSYVSRVPIWWSTVAVLEKWDYIYLWYKLSTQVDYDWNTFDQWRWSVGKIAFLGYDANREVDVEKEPWVTISVALISPLTDYF